MIVRVLTSGFCGAAGGALAIALWSIPAGAIPEGHFWTAYIGGLLGGAIGGYFHTRRSQPA
jgi:hypothetical protein